MANKRIYGKIGAPEAIKIPLLAYEYAVRVVRGRWYQAELTIMTDPFTAYEYARNVINGRWHEAEPYIKIGRAHV